MAQSYVTFTGDGTSVGPITLGFSYILKSHVKVYRSRDILDSTSGTLLSETTDYTWNTAGTQISMVTAPDEDVVITVERQTPNDTQIVPYADGSNLIAESLNNADKQTLFCTQELEDRQELSAAKADAAKTASDLATTNVTQVVANYFKNDGSTTLAGNLTITGTVDGRDVAADGTKLDTIQNGAKDDQTGAEIKAAYESESDTNAFTDAEKAKVGGTQGFNITDNVELTFGVGNDLKIYHSSTNNASYIREVNTLESLRIQAENLVLEDLDGNDYLIGFPDGSTQLYHHGDARLVTTTTGITVFEGAFGSETNHGAIVCGNITSGGNITVNGTVDGVDIAALHTTVSGITSNATHTGDVTGSTALTIADNAVTLAKMANLDRGKIICGDSSNNPTALAPGSANQVLTSNGTDISWADASSGGGMDNIVEDTTPQLGGNLDVQASEITTSTTNGNVKLTPNGTGLLEVKGNTNPGTIQLNCENNSHGVKIKGPLHSAAASYTLTLPNTNGSADQVLKTDGSGNLDWVAQTAAYTNSNVDSHLNQSNPTSGYVLSWNGSDYAWVAQSGGGSSYTDSSVDSHLNQSNPTSGHVLSWNGSDYAWVAQSESLSSDAQFNTVGGANAGDSFSGSNAEYNTLIGYNAGTEITSADGVVAIGSNALATHNQTSPHETTLYNTTVVGTNAGQDYTGIGALTAVGRDAAKDLTTGSYCTFIGSLSGKDATASSNVTAVGAESLYSLTTGANNCAIGAKAGYTNTLGEANVFVGAEAGRYVNPTEAGEGSNNILIGHEAGAASSGTGLTTGSNNIVIGQSASQSSQTVSNEITLGNTSVTKFRIPGLNSFEINDSGQFSGVASTASGTAGVRKITASTSSPSGGSDGDIWIKYTA